MTILIFDCKGLEELRLEDVLRNQDRTSHPGKKLKERKERMRILRGCSFALRDSRNFDKLTSRLIEYIDSLQKMCSENDCDVSITANRWPMMTLFDLLF